MEPKHQLRRNLIEKRLDISIDRRKEANKLLQAKLLQRLELYTHILSFASKKEEIDLSPINHILAEETRLYLPRVKKGNLQAYQVLDLNKDLEESGRWEIKEPRLDRCEEIAKDKLDCILVPGLGFDQNNHRIGYGLGHFDRFLEGLTCPIFGIGFLEQLSTQPFPVEPHDIALSAIILF